MFVIITEDVLLVISLDFYKDKVKWKVKYQNIKNLPQI